MKNEKWKKVKKAKEPTRRTTGSSMKIVDSLIFLKNQDRRFFDSDLFFQRIKTNGS